MLDQSFTAKNLRYLVTFDDLIKYKFGVGENAVIPVLERVATQINSPDYSFSILKQTKIGKNTIFTPSRIEDEFSLRKLNNNLQRLYKFHQANRNLIIDQIRSLLIEEVPMSIIKLDIKKFYETIDKQIIYKKLLDDPLLSFSSKTILRKFFSQPVVSEQSGLPRGINISASLSEILLRDFDRSVSRQKGVYFYARYVDDIIIFSYSDPIGIVEMIDEILATKTGLALNRDKTKIIQRLCRCKILCVCRGECKCLVRCHCEYDSDKDKFFDYLGYRFAFSDIARHSNKLVITLAESKIKKIKTRIIRSFLDFLKNHDFDLLERRISFLTGNFIAKRTNDGETLNAGIYYNYPHINEAGLAELDNLNTFLRSTINSRNKSFGTKIRALLTDENRSLLSKYSFRSGFKNRKLKRFTGQQIKVIKKCWVNE